MFYRNWHHKDHSLPSSFTRMVRAACLVGLTVAAIAACATLAAAQTETILYTFGASPDATEPRGSLVSDAAGNFYGNSYSGGAYGGGSVYELSPPAVPGGAWTEQVIYSFNSVTGDLPLGNMAIDKAGNLYGTTSYEGDPTCKCGSVYKLKPPTAVGGNWIFKNLHNFINVGGDGAYPEAGVALDSKGSIYGMTDLGGNGYGAIYKIASAGTGFVETVLAAFPAGGYGFDGNLLFDSAGNLYGVSGNGGAYSNGSVFELSPPASSTGNWTLTTLWSFRNGLNSRGYFPQGPLVMDSKGQLFGTNVFGGSLSNGAPGSGTVFRLTPPAVAGGVWSLSTLYVFTGGADGGWPFSGVILNPKTGIFYGTTVATSRVVFSLTPPAAAGGAWTELTLHTFTGNPDGSLPDPGLTFDASENLVGATAQGGSVANSGVVYQIVP